MSEMKRETAEELAYRLWEKQGKPEIRSGENLLEPESMAQALAAPLPPATGEDEVDLRMRGLGPLTQPEPSSPRPDADERAKVI